MWHNIGTLYEAAARHGRAAAAYSRAARAAPRGSERRLIELGAAAKALYAAGRPRDGAIVDAGGAEPFRLARSNLQFTGLTHNIPVDLAY